MVRMQFHFFNTSTAITWDDPQSQLVKKILQPKGRCEMSKTPRTSAWMLDYGGNFRMTYPPVVVVGTTFFAFCPGIVGGGAKNEKL